MIVKLLGWAFARPAFLAALKWWVGEDHEYKGGHLFDAEGNLYMGRWTIIEQGSRAGKVLGFLTGGQYDHVRLHWIRQSDGDRELHDHPFNYRTFILKGWYNEEFIDSTRHRLLNGPALRQWQGSKRHLPEYAMLGVRERRLMKPGMSALSPLGQFHRIAQVADDGVWTLFCMGQDTGKWGFLVDGRWMRSHDFFKLRRIHRSGVALDA